MIFQKKDIIFSNGIGVCVVTDIVNLSVNKQMPVQYYLLCSIFDKKKVSYIPVNEHQVLLRPLISIEEAKKKQNDKEITYHEQREIDYLLKKI